MKYTDGQAYLPTKSLVLYILWEERMYVKHLLNEKEQQNPSFDHSKASQIPSHSDAEGYLVCPSWGLDLNNKTLLSLNIAVIVSLEEGCDLVFSVLSLGQE